MSFLGIRRTFAASSSGLRAATPRCRPPSPFLPPSFRLSSSTSRGEQRVGARATDAKGKEKEELVVEEEEEDDDDKFFEEWNNRDVARDARQKGGKGKGEDDDGEKTWDIKHAVIDLEREEYIAPKLEKLIGRRGRWQLSWDGRRLARTFRFATFVHAKKFLKQVLLRMGATHHYPALTNECNVVGLTWSTPEKGPSPEPKPNPDGTPAAPARRPRRPRPERVHIGRWDVLLAAECDKYAVVFGELSEGERTPGLRPNSSKGDIRRALGSKSAVKAARILQKKRLKAIQGPG